MKPLIRELAASKGFLISYDDWHDLVYFGDASESLSSLGEKFPSLAFLTLHQFHSDLCVDQAHVASIEKKADAHFTSLFNVALVVKTADCIPLLVSAPDRILAVHAGWRGVENQIAMKCLDVVQAAEASLCFIGPHIQKQSFEIDKDVCEKLCASININLDSDASSAYQTKKNDKYHFNLELAVRSQLQSREILPDQIFSINEDTVTNPRWHSFRRDRSASGRNFSFIARMTEEPRVPFLG